jgi:hypothetical protein
LEAGVETVVGEPCAGTRARNAGLLERCGLPDASRDRHDAHRNPEQRKHPPLGTKVRKRPLFALSQLVLESQTDPEPSGDERRMPPSAFDLAAGRPPR